MATDPRDSADTVRQQLDRRILALREDLRLDQGVRVREMAQAYVDARAEMNTLKASFVGYVADERAALERRVFAPPGSAPATAEARVARDASFRDALERAERCANQDDLRALQRRAVRVGDDYLEQACLVLAAEHAWQNAVDDYGSRHPESADAALELIAFNQTVDTAQFQFFQQQAAFALQKPRELVMTPDWMIEAVAAGRAAV